MNDSSISLEELHQQFDRHAAEGINTHVLLVEVPDTRIITGNPSDTCTQIAVGVDAKNPDLDLTALINETVKFYSGTVKAAYDLSLPFDTAEVNLTSLKI